MRNTPPGVTGQEDYFEDGDPEPAEQDLEACIVCGASTIHRGSCVLLEEARHDVPACWRHRLGPDHAEQVAERAQQDVRP